MSGLQAMQGKRVTVWGLGRFGGGVAAARHLARAGARVTVIDRKGAAELRESVAALAEEEVELVLGREHREQDLLEAELVVRSPAIPPASPWMARIRAAGVPMTAEIVLGLQELQVPYAMVTGSKGKTTTASLLGAMLAAQAPCFVAGNNERPLLEAARAAGPELAWAVIEVSSFMAEAIAEARRAGVSLPAPAALALTSLSPEHLNWHGSVEAYYGAKLSLLELGPAAVVFPATDPELSVRVPAAARGRLVRTGLRPDETELWASEGRVVEAAAEGPRALFRRGELQLLGEHNLGNALVATATARVLGASPQAVANGVAGFRPIAHRLETVAVSAAGVRFVNDSTATTPEAAMAALRAVPGPVVALLGGSDKGADYADLGRVAAGVRAAVCLGEVGDRIAQAVEAARAAGAGAAELVRAASFEEAFAAGLERCESGGTLLLSPAAASYDMFANFKARGERFRELARAAAGSPA